MWELSEQSEVSPTQNKRGKLRVLHEGKEYKNSITFPTTWDVKSENATAFSNDCKFQAILGSWERRVTPRQYLKSPPKYRRCDVPSKTVFERTYLFKMHGTFHVAAIR